MIDLDVADIQGNIHARMDVTVFQIAAICSSMWPDTPSEDGAKAGRIRRSRFAPEVTTSDQLADATEGRRPAGRRDDKPPVTLNIGFTLYGLMALGVPLSTLRTMPDEFIQGMAKRNEIVGDIGDSAPGKWDPIWVASNKGEDAKVHIMGLAQRAGASCTDYRRPCSAAAGVRPTGCSALCPDVRRQRAAAARPRAWPRRAVAGLRAPRRPGRLRDGRFDLRRRSISGSRTASVIRPSTAA